jgi:hypothetical protein
MSGPAGQKILKLKKRENFWFRVGFAFLWGDSGLL